MHHFFVEPSQIQDGRIVIEGSDVNHIKNVLRMKPGEYAEISDGTMVRYLCTAEEVESGQIVFLIQDFWKDDRELSSKIYLFQGLPKSDKMEWIIQKAVELGVYEVVPVVTRRTVVKLDERKTEKKVSRWNAVAEAAAKQSGRGMVPAVHTALSFSEALDYAGRLDVLLIPYEKAENMQETKQALEGILPGQSVGIFIGPEGGFEEQEICQAQDAKAHAITLGRRLLRTETAGLAALSILMYHLELKDR